MDTGYTRIRKRIRVYPWLRSYYFPTVKYAPDGDSCALAVSEEVSGRRAVSDSNCKFNWYRPTEPTVTPQYNTSASGTCFPFKNTMGDCFTWAAAGAGWP